MADSTHALPPAGALLAVGRIADDGNPVMASGPQNTLGIFAPGGATGYADGTSIEYLAAETQEFEPYWLTNGTGYNLHAAYVDAATGYSNQGNPVDQGTENGFTYGAAGTLSWGGRAGDTKRNSRGSHVALAAWDVAPTGADHARVMQFCADITSEGDTDGITQD
ncbi:hypothetical protein KMP13_20085 [Epibacterium ulvae]|nr:hypothetical protein [Epibacterium ulvae]